ncbi:MAG: suppressor of fused domain protein [Planctomycetia bacterium]|nr:suppressor of fused domain protein [Planctomycetia bacterium]
MMMANKSFQSSDGKTVHLHQVTPIYASEREYELTRGLPALMQVFDRADVPYLVDLHRKPVV